MGEYDEPKKTRGQKFKEGWNGFCKFLYNGENKTVMGRGGASWAKIGVFYLIFYSCLAGFFAGLLAIFMKTQINGADNVGRENAGPKLTQYIVNSPGLTLVRDPIEAGDDFNRTKEIIEYREAIDKYLGAFGKVSPLTTTCPQSEEGYSGDEPCRFDTSLLGNCNMGGDYGYKRTKNGTDWNDMPCIFVKMNKVWGWVPDNDGNVYLQLACSVDGDTSKVDVVPGGGFLKSAFPYLGHQGYQYPAVAVQVKDTTVKSLVQCELKGAGIEVSSSYNPQRSFGKIEFTVNPLS